MRNVVIVGTGQGGLQAAASLRQEGFSGDVVMIGEEPALPYARPPLSKTYLADGDGAALILKTATFFERAGIRLLSGCRAATIDRAAHAVALGDGRRVPYDHLILATGTRNRVPPIPGADAEGVLALRTLADAERLRTAMAGARRTVVVGGGFIGLEFAAVARKAGLAVTVVEAASRLMARAVSPAISTAFLTLHRRLGVDVRLNVAVEEVMTDGRNQPCGVRVSDGSCIDGDLILMAVGVRPNVELAAEAGLSIADGIVVDGRLQTSDPSISALGDVCAFPHAKGRVRLEAVQVGVDHARYIARVLTGAGEGDYDAVPWFWSDQADWKLQIAGLPLGADEEVVRVQETGALAVLHFGAGQLLSAETVNDARSHMAARKLIGLRKTELEKVGYDLRSALKSV